MRHLNIDIETYSSVSIRKAGLYKYAMSPDFQILLFGYSVDGSPVRVLERAFMSAELLGALFDPSVVKHAYNAAFEWFCLSRWLKLSPQQASDWLPQWRDTQLHALYLGYPASLDAAGKALGLPEDKRKLAAGKALIKYFCTPCAPTKSNGGRTRNLPHHDPEKWDLFKQYNAQDVVTEMEVERRLSNFPVPPETQQQWVTDQIINARGVAADLDLIEGALWCGDTVRRQLMTEAKQISGLDNPNSLRQLTKWLEQELDEELPDLRKDTVKELLGRDIDSDGARRMLEIRQELGKTSTKKYNAMETALCDDGRIRGMMQFYGANRTGRWAGRIVQPQNLPQTHLPCLPLARELVKGRRLDALQLVYGSIPATLSQLIRTAFVAAPGHTFIDADFSAIEARVIAWLAGEQWRMDVFRTHGKIYEASASAMFNVPIEEITKGSPLRQKGKVAELALGYQGSTGALITMGALKMGLTEDELPDIVTRWREANPNIVRLWYDIEAAAVEAVKTGCTCPVRGVAFARECDVKNELDFLTVRLPSGRKLYYARPTMTVNRWGRESLGYYGANQTTKKWELIETYGGKLVENIIQAIARDCLAVAIERLTAAGYRVVFHVHDEVVIEAPAETADLDAVAKIMAQPVSWAPDLPLRADGWVGEFYKKD